MKRSAMSRPSDAYRLAAKVGGTLHAMARLRAAGVHVDGLVRFGGRAPAILNEGRMRIGDRTYVEGRFVRSSLVSGADGLLSIGAFSYISWGCSLAAQGSVVIGERAHIAPRVVISDSSFHEVAPGDGVPIRPVLIGRNVWLGHGAIVLPGTTIGDHSVVAAGAVVRGDVPDRVVVAGVPAKVVRHFDAPDDWTRS